jgi:two-component system C4-dicarboxylate transport sensor histidine kinase DctB
VIDTGQGIPEATMQHLFEPFFSTKPLGEGLGLGLVISSSIVREFGGVLRAVNTPSGASFEFDLPIAEEHIHV